jgi:HK97 family phage prohead protease
MPEIPKGLPDTVAARIGDVEAVCTRFRGDLVESRRSGEVEVRRLSDDRAEIHGYATVYDYPYDVFGGPPFGFTETIAAGATKKSVREKDDVRLLLNHDGMPLARTKSGTLSLRSDDVGLLVDAELDLRSAASRDAVLAMERGDLDEMSFAFQAIRQDWNDDYTDRTIREVKLFDVSLVTFPANPAASAYLRDGDDRSHGMSLSLAMAEAEALSLRQ